MFEIGEWVKIKPVNEIHDTVNLYFLPEMHCECEREVQIISKEETSEGRTEYNVEQNNWTWDEDWLEPISHEIQDFSETEFDLLFNR